MVCMSGLVILTTALAVWAWILLISLGVTSNTADKDAGRKS